MSIKTIIQVDHPSYRRSRYVMPNGDFSGRRTRANIYETKRSAMVVATFLYHVWSDEGYEFIVRQLGDCP